MPKAPPTGTKVLGTIGEKAAAEFLKRKGYEILDVNFTCPLGELDIVARDGRTIVFVEVKTRSAGQIIRPKDQVGQRKIQRLSALAVYYRKKMNLLQTSGRFDVIGVIVGPAGMEIEHIEHAFELHQSFYY
ncbi:MAG: YraN family protein [Deltaproteobacteria bacterium]|nr:YraN family protein [Deltaproteobacteria bacterium]